MQPVPLSFFERPALDLARALVGRLLVRRRAGLLLVARVVEAEAYARHEKASHSSLGRTPSREPMFAAPGTIYMYRSRGGPSLNVSAHGAGDAVLFKSAVLACDGPARAAMHALNPSRSGAPRPDPKLLAGQSLLCRALDLETAAWTGRPFGGDLVVADDGVRPRLVQTTRLGIPAGRDEHLPWRFVHAGHLGSATKDPTRRRGAVEGRDWWFVEPAG